MSLTTDRAWAYQIRLAQRETFVTVGTAIHPRIPYGQERHWAKAQVVVPATPCRDCGVLPGQFHVSYCCIEACPLCLDGQRVSCVLEGCVSQDLWIDHVKPLRKGGHHTMKNVVPACPDCLSAFPERNPACVN